MSDTLERPDAAIGLGGRALVLPDGIYLNLAESTYHNATALGSGDMRRLAVSPPDFWFNSKMNPLWEEDDAATPAKIVGSATHAMVLYGMAEFMKHYAFTRFPGNRKDGIEERKRIRDSGRIPIKAADYERIQQVGAIVRGNRVLANAFSGGIATEISIFWTGDSGIQKKCRIDYLKQRASVDLKTITNTSDHMDFVTACRHAIASYDYPVQAEHYREGREQMARLIDENMIYLDEVHTETLAIPAGMYSAVGDLRRAAQSEFAFVMIFVQKTGAPLTHGVKLSKGNGVLDLARRKIERAEDNWRWYMDRFGADTPWLLEEPLDELSVEELPAWWGR